MTITIHGVLKSLANQRWHHLTKAKYVKRWREDVSLMCLVIEVPKANGKARHVIATRYGVKMLDADNLASAFKPVLDGLKDAGVIVDDAPGWLTVEYRQVGVKRGQERIVLEVLNV